MSAHLRFKVGPVVVTKRLEASKEKRSIVPVLVGAVFFFGLYLIMMWVA